MSVSNLLAYNQNYSMTSGSLWNYYRDEIDDVGDNASNGKPFKYKSKIVGKTPEIPPRPLQPQQPPPNLDGSQPPPPPQPPQPPVPALNVEFAIPSKYLSIFWRSLDLPLINCEIEPDSSWTKDCVFSEHHNSITGAHFTINTAKL